MNSIEAKATSSLRFHESKHVEDFQKYTAEHDLPRLALVLGMTPAEVVERIKEYQRELQQYVNAAEEYSTKQTDCIGVPMKGCP